MNRNSSQRQTPMRNPGLDLLRLLAIVLVLGRHLQGENLPATLQLWQRGGWIGVDLFFVLSGFLVSGLLFREQKRDGQIAIGRFLIRRALKIYPAFWFFLAFSCIALPLVGSAISWKACWGEWLFLQNYMGGLWPHTWSLAVEEHFYLLLAVVIGCCRIGKRDAPFPFIPTLFFVVAAACLGMRCANHWMCSEYSLATSLFPSHLRIDSLFFGVLVAYAWHYHNLEQRISSTPTWLLVAIGASLMSPAFVWSVDEHRWIAIYGVILLYLGSGCILLAALRVRRTDSLIVRGLQSLGAASYSIYLWHMPVNAFAFPAIYAWTGFSQFEVYLASYLIGSLVFGWMMHRLVEAPVLVLRDRIFPSGRPEGMADRSIQDAVLGRT